MPIDLTGSNTINEILKVVAILFALFHFLVGFVLVSRVTSMEKALKTKNNTIFNLINLGYLILLIVIIVLIILL